VGRARAASILYTGEHARRASDEVIRRVKTLWEVKESTQHGK
jgi:hypothetical protein